VIRRREVITLLGGAAAAWPLAARGQQPALPVIGYLYAGAPETSVHLVAAFRKGLSQTGYVDGQNVSTEFRWTYNDFHLLPELAADLVRRQVAVNAAPGSTTAAVAAKAATTRIPIVFSGGADPIQAGLVASLNQPGGNVTGISTMNAALGAKRLDLLHGLLPRAARIAVLVNPVSPLTVPFIAELRAAAPAIDVQIEVFNTASPAEIDLAFGNLVQWRADAVMSGVDTLFVNRRVQIATLAAYYHLPMVNTLREQAEAGGLLSYGSSFTELFRQTGVYVGRILKGEKPADLPVMQATQFELVINMQTAKTLGIQVPPTLLAIADDVVE
jgi:putative ABC transport system substrate-binding protein